MRVANNASGFVVWSSAASNMTLLLYSYIRCLRFYAISVFSTIYFGSWRATKEKNNEMEIAMWLFDSVV